MQVIDRTLSHRSLSHRSLTRCLVCGFGEVRTDEVVDRELVQLAECPRCEHRWTTRVTTPQVMAPRSARPFARMARSVEDPATAA